MDWTRPRQRLAEHAWLLPPLLALLPHLPHLPVWLAAGCLAFWVWRTALAIGQRGLPHPYLLGVLGLGGVVAVFGQFGQVFGQRAGVPLFLLLIFIKLLETATPRQRRLLLLLNYFTVLSHFLSNQSLVMAAYMLGVLWLITAAMAQQSDDRPPARPLVASLVAAGRLLVVGLPLALLLFLFFPRLDHPLWSLPSGETAARTGLSDSMTPGDIGRLTLSGEVAFRAVFAGPPPDPRGLYWRGPVLTDFDGRAWRVAERQDQDPTQIQARGPALAYTLTLEPHERDWIFTLGLPTGLPQGTRLLAGMQLVADQPLNQRRRLALESHPEYRLGATTEELAQALALPPDFNPQARQLAAGWRAQARTPRDLIVRALALYRDQFTYTLEPPPLGLDSMDDFLFRTRRGFCEHFAGSFVFLMRAAGLPARVVTGYQGGELNPIDGHLLVRQSEAHAWAEVWLPDLGWTQVDPTASVSPTRVEQGLAAALPARELPAALARLNADWLRGLRHLWESANHGWNQWVLGYSLERQLRLLSRLNPGLPRNTATLAALTVAAALAVMLALAWRAGRLAPEDPALRLYHRLHRRLGLTPVPGEDPRQYARRAGLQHPTLAGDIQQACRLYEEARYAGRRQALEELERRIARMRPAGRRHLAT